MHPDASPETRHRESGKTIPVVTEDQLQLQRDQRERAALYNALGALLAVPAQGDTLESLRSLPDAEDAETPLEISWQLVRRAAHSYDPQQIDDEFHDLFVGLGRGEIVPYGSWHLTGFLMEKPLGALRADLRRLGFERADGVSESEDHIASLCQVMAAIIIAEDIDFDTEKAFFGEHLAPWAPDFFSALQNAAAAGFYRAVGNLGHSFFEVEKNYLSMPV